LYTTKQLSKTLTYKHYLDTNLLKNLFIYRNSLIIKTNFGYKTLFLPNFYFFKKVQGGIKFIFSDYHKYNVVLRQLKNILINSCKIYFFKLKLRGLGYKLYSHVRRRIVKFFFAYNHFFYLHVPKYVFFKKLKRKFIFYSNNLPVLNDLFVKVTQLKKMDFYERANTFIVPKKILYIKKRK